MLETKMLGSLDVMRALFSQIEVLLECLADFSPATSAEISWALVLTEYDVVVVFEGIAQCCLEGSDNCVCLVA